jgi:hypothetical protein
MVNVPLGLCKSSAIRVFYRLTTGGSIGGGSLRLHIRRERKTAVAWASVDTASVGIPEP